MCKILYIPVQIQIIKDKTPGSPKAHNEVSLHLKRVARNGYLMVLSFNTLPDILKIPTSPAFVCLPKEATALNIIRNVSL